MAFFMVSPQLLEELKIILKEDYKINLEQKEVFEIGSSLVSFFDSLMKMKFESKYKKHVEENK